MPANDPVPPSGDTRTRHPRAAADTSVSRESVRTGSFVPGPADESVHEPLPATVGRFEILGLLGEGGFGRVYRARDPQLDREVALKVPRPGVLAGPADRERFLREARAAATLQHPNLCPVHEVGQDGDCDYIVMAYVAGKSLAALLKERTEPMADKKIVPLIRKLALALDAAHQNGVVHRDLKPANVLYDPVRKDLVVTDFGLARRAKAGEAELTHSGMIVGTPAYMPPEQARGDVKAIGPAADIYSLGVILYELLTGKRPFTGTVGEVIGQVLHVEPEPPSKVRPGVNPQLEAICLKAMAKNPAARYASMREFAAALADSNQGTVTSVTTSQPFGDLQYVPTPKTPARQVRWPWIAAAGVAGLALVWGGSRLFIHSPRQPDPGQAIPADSDPKTNPLATADGFVPLFNGKDLTGWKAHPAAGAMPWAVVDGSLTCTEERPENVLFTERDNFRDVHVRVECQFSPLGGGGLIVRTPFSPQTNNGYCVIIGAQPRTNTFTGTFRVKGGAPPAVPVLDDLVKPDTWATVEFVVRGHRCTVQVDGRQVADYEDADRLWASGHIGLQFRAPYPRSNYQAIRFRKVEVKELPAAPPAPAATSPPGSVADGSPDREVAESALDLGGTVRLAGHPNHYGPGGKPKAELPAGPFSVVYVEIADKPNAVRTEHFTALARLTKLVELRLPRSPFGAEGLAQIAGSKSLVVFVATDCRLTDKDLVPLTKLGSLVILNLEGNPSITDASLDSIVKLTKLQGLCLRGTGVTDVGIEKLTQSTLPIVYLEVPLPAVTDHALWAIGRLGYLHQLDISGTRITADGIPHLVATQKLESLSAANTALTDTAVPHLKRLTGLKRLVLSNCPITAAGLSELKAALPNCTIELEPKVAATQPGQPADGFVPLFNGKDLTGWKVHSDTGSMPWTVVDGALKCNAVHPANVLLTERGDYRDVHVRAECKFSRNGAGGIVVRAPVEPRMTKGYQLAIGAQPRNKSFTGTLKVKGDGSSEVLVLDDLVPVDTWATIEFIVRGHHCNVVINGKPVVDYEDAEKRWTSGHIGLQFRTPYVRYPNQAIWFRKVEVKENPAAPVLPSAKSPPEPPAKPLPAPPAKSPPEPVVASTDRQAAELVLDLGGYFALEGQPDWFGGVGKGKADLPAGRFRVSAITLNERPDIVRPEHFALFAQLEGLKSLHLHGSPFAAEGVAKLAASKSLEDFQPAGCNLRDADLAPLAGLASLTSLNLNHNEALTNASIDTLAKLKKLGGLVLTGTKIGDAGLEKLAQSGVPLTSIQVSKPITDRGLKALSSIPTLRGIDVSGSLISATGLANLAGAKALESLSVSGTATSNDAIPHLKGLKTLKSLNLNGTPVNNVGLEKLAQTGLPLTALQVGCRGVSGRGLESLSRITSLTSLNISETGVTNDSLSWLAPLKKLESLSAANTALSDGAVQHLAKLKGLQELDLTDTKVSAKALRELKKALPECTIEPAP